MSQNKQQQSNQAAIALANIVGQIGCATTLASVVIIGLAFALGNFLDNLFGTRPIFIFIALFGSLPLTLYVIVRISLAAVARAQQVQTRVTEQEQHKDEASR